MQKNRLFKLFGGPYLFHVLVWLVYGVYNLMSIQEYVIKKGWVFSITPFIISILLVAMLIYVNALLLIPKFLDKKKIVLYIIAVLLLVIFNTYLRSLTLRYYDGLVWPKDKMNVLSYFKWNLFNSFWSILISTLLLFSLRWSKQRETVKTITIEQLQTELKYLRSQINPHFLFNGLNTVYGNIDINNHEARTILLQFSDLLRYHLYDADTDLIELSKEATYLENYVALQKARSNTNLDIDLVIKIEDQQVKVAPLIFVTFVENAFKFITRDDDTTNFVKINLEQTGKNIFFSCINSHEDGETLSGGIGLKNVKRRLELLYRDRYQLEITKDSSIYTVKLTLII